MSETLAKVQIIADREDIRISAHGYDELAADGIFFTDILAGLGAAAVVEDYPNAARGPSVLVLQKDSQGRAIHVVWGIPRGREAPAVLVTAYRPEPSQWSSDFTKRTRR